ncbi:MAG: PINc/VapC family ATPase [Candidatus Micrarchaeota archaeon]|nr:PINc/VapC family ATPase [Candidatus Micrarchaeota archaeon]
MKTIVPDTGVLIDGRVSEIVSREKSAKIIIPLCAVAELEHQANSGSETGFTGLDELKKLVQIAEREKGVTIEYAGERPGAGEIENARFGEIDAMVRAVAKKHGATLYTTDRVQNKVAEAEGIEVVYLAPIVAEAKLEFAKYFNPETLSVHLKEGCLPKAKVGLPGAFELREAGRAALSRDEIEKMVKEAVEYSKRVEKSFIEIDLEGATVLQVGPYRVIFTKPPVSEAFELTVVKPIRKMTLDEYNIPKELYARLGEKVEGLLVSGPPGSGKSTFATALAEHYAAMKKIVKTLEQPRDLQVGKEITQYAPIAGSFENTADILLLVRPDYTIFDEVRKPDDFRVFADLRLSGIGMIGVVHAAEAIDAMQRFIGKIDLGVIPEIIDTIVFIERGRVAKVLDLKFTVKQPYGMTERDLARPVIEVKDLITGVLEYEIYKFGEETVVLPVREVKAKKKHVEVDAGRVKKILEQHIGGDYEVEFEAGRVIVFVPERMMPRLIGKQGKNIAELEKRLGLAIDLRPK